ncbi:MAG: hypothetical protein ACOC0P_01805 [Planctomycetota bacterium]
MRSPIIIPAKTGPLPKMSAAQHPDQPGGKSPQERTDQAVDVDALGPAVRERWCIGCGYNLGYNDMGSPCPECGATSNVDLTSDIAADWRQTARQGMLLLMLSLFIGVPIDFLSFAPYNMVPAWVWNTFAQTLRADLLLSVAANAVGLIGVWILTRPVPRAGVLDPRSSLRRYCRGLAVFSAGSLLLYPIFISVLMRVTAPVVGSSGHESSLTLLHFILSAAYGVVPELMLSLWWVGLTFLLSILRMVALGMTGRLRLADAFNRSRWLTLAVAVFYFAEAATSFGLLIAPPDTMSISPLAWLVRDVVRLVFGLWEMGLSLGIVLQLWLLLRVLTPTTADHHVRSESQ